MKNAVRAELRKLRYTRSLWAVPVGGVVITAVAAMVLVSCFKSADIAGQLSQHGALRFGPTNLGLLLVLFGVRLLADETHHRTLPVTFLRSPERRTVLTAKAVVAGATAVTVCIAVFAIVLPTTLVAREARDLPMTLDWADTAALFGRDTVAMTLAALLGVGLAASIRNRAVALVAIVIWLSMAENIVGALLHVERFLPAALVRAVVSGGGRDLVAAPLAAAALTAFVLAAFAAGDRALRRDSG